MIVTDPALGQPLAIRTFGALTVALGGGTQPIHFATHTVEALLVYLACQDRPLGRDELAELVWPERTQEQARMNLRVALYRLRQQIDPYLLITRQQLALNPDAVVELDAGQFERHLAAGELAMATALYRGDFLGGFYLDGSPAFEQWALLERERLRTLAIGAYQQLVDQAATAGQLDAAIAYARRLLQLDPLHEPTHRQLMRLLAHAGQRSAALAQYETCRALLAAELGVAPDGATTAVYQQICLGEVTARQEQAGPRAEPPAIGDPPEVTDNIAPTRPLPLVPHNLPRQPTPLIGRSAELAQIESLLANPDCRLLTLLGAGGIGKTRLAIEAAGRMLAAEAAAVNSANYGVRDPHFPDGVCFVALAAVERAELLLATIAQSLDLQVTGSDLRAEIAAHLQGRTLLLVLDNFEHLAEAADTVAQLLQSAASIKLLVTSRERLHLREEWLMPVAGLALAEGLLSEAGQLFFRSAQRVQPAFSTYGQEEAIAAICKLVEGMPLAIELAASWVRVMPCGEIAQQLGYNSHIFTTTLRNVPERHRSLRSLFDQSWRLLSPAEQNVLRRVSVFRGGWTPDEAAQVADATFPVLVDLVDKSLVRTNGQGRFDLHELVRQYAAEQLADSGEVDLIRQRHLATYLQIFRTGDGHLRGPESANWFARLEAEQDNLRAALQWALDEGRYEDAAWLMLAVDWYRIVHGDWYEAGQWLMRLLPHRHTLATNLRMATLIHLCAIARAVEEFQPVDQYLAELMQLMEGGASKLLHGHVWYFIAVHALDFPKAADALERSIACTRAARDAPALGAEFCLFTDLDFMLVTALWLYATLLIERGEFARAEPLVMESLKLFRARENQYEIADGLGTSGLLALLQGDVTRAYMLLRETVTLAAAVNGREMLGTWQPLLGLATLYKGDAIEARRLLNEGLTLCLELKDKALLARVCTYLAEVNLWEENSDQAELRLAQSLAYQTDPDQITFYQVGRLFVAARLATAQQRYGRAATLFGLADHMHSAIHHALAGPIRELAEEALATVRAALDPAEFAAAFETGRQLTLGEAFATILAPAKGALPLTSSQP